MKILCFRNSKLGDYLISIPVLKLIKKKFPNSKLIYLSAENKNCKYLPKNIENQKIVDRFIFYKNSIFGLFKLIFKLRKQNIHKVINLNEETNFYKKFRNYIFFSFCKIPNKVSFFYVNKSYAKFSETIQLVQRIDNSYEHSNIYNFLKIKKKKDIPLIKSKYITISHGGLSSPKLWPLKSWNKLLKLILINFNYKIIILGTYSERKKANLLQMVDKNRIINMCGNTTIKDLFNIIKYSKLHITNDNGTMHIATIFSLKTICLFNNHDPYGKWFPENNNAVIVRPKLGINKISAQTIYKKFKTLI